MNYNLKIFYKDYYYAVKEIIKVKDPFVISSGLCLIDNGYYIMEIIPKNEHYSIRVYFDENKNILEYYIDISLENGIDEDELEEALNKNIISKEDYLLAYRTKDKLLEEIKNKSNKYLNMNLVKML